MGKGILFLDIDGVLTNRATGFERGDPSCVAALNFITDGTGAAIVLISTRRHDPNITDLLRKWGVTGEILGVTPDRSWVNSHGLIVNPGRGVEITYWREHTQCGDTAFAILDDENTFGALDRWLVKIDIAIGLCQADAERAIEILRRKDFYQSPKVQP